MELLGTCRLPSSSRSEARERLTRFTHEARTHCIFISIHRPRRTNPNVHCRRCHRHARAPERNAGREREPGGEAEEDQLSADVGESGLGGAILEPRLAGPCGHVGAQRLPWAHDCERAGRVASSIGRSLASRTNVGAVVRGVSARGDGPALSSAGRSQSVPAECSSRDDPVHESAHDAHAPLKAACGAIGAVVALILRRDLCVVWRTGTLFQCEADEVLRV